jgi:hypothetical protein
MQRQLLRKDTLLRNHRATLIVLYRPYVTTDDGVSLKEEDRWQAESYQKAKSAASKINAVLEKLIDINMVKYFKPMTWVFDIQNNNRC